jgi:hypothetical protein
VREAVGWALGNAEGTTESGEGKKNRG